MKNILAPEVGHSTFSWNNLGDISKGRANLGEDVPVLVYRLMQYTLLDVLCREYGQVEANKIFRQAGFLAGSEFAKNILDVNVDFDTFVAQLQRKLQELKIGILRIEVFDSESGEIVLTVGEDLDCSGLPVTDEMVCTYDEGFLAGILEAYSGKKYLVNEIDCWANGNRVCRFRGIVKD